MSPRDTSPSATVKQELNKMNKFRKNNKLMDESEMEINNQKSSRNRDLPRTKSNRQRVISQIRQSIDVANRRDQSLNTTEINKTLNHRSTKNLAAYKHSKNTSMTEDIPFKNKKRLRIAESSINEDY